MKQIEGRIWFGRLKIVFTRVSSYFGYINFVLMLSTFYAVKGFEYAPFWMFCVSAFVLIIVIGFVDYFFVLPSEQAFLNQQCVRHQNPIYDEIKELNKKLKRYDGH